MRVGLTKLSVVEARRDLAIARESLRNAMGFDEPLTAPLDPGLSLRPIVMTLDAAIAIAVALTDRPELRSLDSKVEATDHRVSALQKQLLPAFAGGPSTAGPAASSRSTRAGSPA